MSTLWPLAVYFAGVIFLVVIGMVGLSFLLGQRHKDRATGEPYESGIVSQGTARIRLSAKFYHVAMFFVVFDLEAVFIFAWAVAIRDLGWLGYRGHSFHRRPVCGPCISVANGCARLGQPAANTNPSS